MLGLPTTWPAPDDVFGTNQRTPLKPEWRREPVRNHRALLLTASVYDYASPVPTPRNSELPAIVKLAVVNGCTLPSPKGSPRKPQAAPVRFPSAHGSNSPRS